MYRRNGGAVSLPERLHDADRRHVVTATTAVANPQLVFWRSVPVPGPSWYAEPSRRRRRWLAGFEARQPLASGGVLIGIGDERDVAMTDGYQMIDQGLGSLYIVEHDGVAINSGHLPIQQNRRTAVNEFAEMGFGTIPSPGQ